MSALLDMLGGGDRRSIGRSNAVVRHVLADGSSFAEIVEGLSVSDPLVRMRCADAMEKVSAVHPEWLQPHKIFLLDLARHETQKEVRWHLAQMLPRLKLSPGQRRAAISVMFEYLNDSSRIVKAFAMQALAEFAERDEALRDRMLPLLGRLRRNGSPAVRSRARKLMDRLSGGYRARLNE